MCVCVFAFVLLFISSSGDCVDDLLHIVPLSYCSCVCGVLTYDGGGLGGESKLYNGVWDFNCNGRVFINEGNTVNQGA